ncbi:MAG: amidohydrolase family protein [Hydrogenophilaceae bacterium]|jgi:imidazolonepropionase-like amidohydrolase|nr:amidohydrolase family protein [Hydrogenophilaceae bacterium]
MVVRLPLLTAAFVLAACASAPAPRIIAGDEPVTAFTNVRLITEYGGERLGHHTVVVRGDRIIAIAPDRRIALPDDALVIDGAGRLLAPGIADMHAHFQDPGAGPLFLANSITTVRNPSGGDTVPALIAQIARGEVPGPFMYSSGRLIDGAGSFWGAQVVAETVEAVRTRVREDAAAGYHAIKLYNRLTPDQFAAGVDEARASGLQVYAHVPDSMTIEQVLAQRIDSVEHLDGFDRSLGGEGHWPAQRWATARQDRFAALARLAAASNVWQAPTLIVQVAPARAFADLAAAEAAPELRYADASLLEFWRSYIAHAPTGTDFAARHRLTQQGHAQRLAMLRALREANAPLLIGTDTPNPYVMYGFSIHEEFGYFREAGFTNVQILRIATLDAARALGEAGAFGIVREGARADLLLLEDDPEADLSTLRTPAGVMAAGRWYDRAALDSLLADSAARAAASRADPPPP